MLKTVSIVAAAAAAPAAEYIDVASYGAAGDGVTNDTAAIVAAHAASIAAGKALKFGPFTYIYTGQLSINGTRAIWRGEPGLTTLKCGAQSSGGARINFNAAMNDVEGFIFDANGASVSFNAWGVLATGDTNRFHRCKFMNAVGSLGFGLYMQTNATGTVDVFDHGWQTVTECEFTANAQSGLWIYRSDRVTVQNNKAWSNTVHGIRIDAQDPSFVYTVQRSTVSHNFCWSNASCGITIGNFNRDNASGSSVRWDSGFADVRTTIIEANHCWNNTGYGLVLCNDFNTAIDNICTGNGSAAVLMNARDSDLIGGYYQGASPWTIDSGGSLRITIRGCKVRGGGTAINFGACYESSLTECDVGGATYNNIALNILETDGTGVAFQQLGGRNNVRNNVVRMTSSTVKGIALEEGIDGCSVENNDFYIDTAMTYDTVIYNCLDLQTSTATIRGNRVNGRSWYTRNPVANVIDMPDVFDEIHMSSASGTVTAVRPRSHLDYFQRVMFVTTAHKGVGGAAPFTGTLPTSVTFTGGGGTGAAATPFFDQEGYLIGIRMTNRGSGYTSVPTASVTGTGGAGLTLTPTLGGRTLDGRVIRLYSLTAVAVSRGGTVPIGGGSPSANHTIVAGGTLTLMGRFGQWYADTSAQGLSIHGAGAPEGVVTAGIGTLYHRTDGGALTSVYVKESGTGNTGWVAK